MGPQRAVSVTEAMGSAKRALEQVRLRVVGEVSEFADKPGYRAAYFTVADGGAAMPCLMWRDQYQASGVRLRCGMLVEMTGHFSAYAPKGRLQFVVRDLQLAGEGQLRMQVAELARRLEAEGLMREERKRSLPAYPRRIGLVTSPRGKAVHDVVRTLKRRYPLAEIVFAGVPVEGSDAASAIAAGLRTVAEAGPDLVLLVRGGGSYEDLMPFNAEEVARAVVACPVPVVTGIGHEPDTSIADMVADLRASTPTAAAESAAPAIEEVRAALATTSRRLGRALAHRVQHAEHQVAVLARRPVFTDCSVVVGQAAQALDQAALALHRALPARLEREAERVRYAREGLVRVGPRIGERDAERVAVGAAELDALSPLKVLGRGYAVCYTADGANVVRSAAEVGVGDRVGVRVGSGRLGCIVEEVERSDDGRSGL